MRFPLIFIFGTFLLISLISAKSFALCVQYDEAKLRKGPGLDWPITWEVIRYFPLKKMSKQKGWYRVQDLHGDYHWVREDIVTSQFECATVKEEFANLRTGPGTNFAAVPAGKGERYMSFRVVARKGVWVKVEDSEGDQAWVKSDLLFIQ